MNTVIELVKIAKPNKCFLKGKVLALVEAIERGKITSHEDAIPILFKDSAEPNRSLYYLIARTKKALTLSVIYSVKSNNDNQKAYHEAHSGFASAMILLGLGNKAGIVEAKRIFLLAKKYDLVHIANPLAMKLTKYYAEIEPNKNLQRKYAKEARHYADLIQNSTLCNNYYSKALLAINNRSSYSAGTINLLEKFIGELEGKSLNVESTTQLYMMKATLCFAKQDYAAGALVSSEALKRFERNPATLKGSKLLFLSFQSVAAIASGQYEVADSILSKATKMAGKHTNWQIFTYYKAINAIHAKKYFKAQRFRDEATKHPQTEYIKEYWAIISAYLYFFNGGDRFRLGKFFNETIEVSQDKAGLNINIIIADLLISMSEKRDRFLHRIEPVRTYAYRHLKGKAYERVRFFLDMLLQVPRHDFNYLRIERATRLIRRKLERRSVYANHNLEIEIVPFEDLWVGVLGRLGEREMIKGVR